MNRSSFSGHCLMGRCEHSLRNASYFRLHATVNASSTSSPRPVGRSGAASRLVRAGSARFDSCRPGNRCREITRASRFVTRSATGPRLRRANGRKRFHPRRAWPTEECSSKNLERHNDEPYGRSSPCKITSTPPMCCSRCEIELSVCSRKRSNRNLAAYEL